MREWIWTAVIVALAVGLCWVSAQGKGPGSCTWPAGDHRNRTGCIVRVTVTETVTAPPQED